jgi:hypothetical protein
MQNDAFLALKEEVRYFSPAPIAAGTCGLANLKFWCPIGVHRERMLGKIAENQYHLITKAFSMILKT